MSREYIELGPVPYDEACQQVGMPGYDRKKAQSECAMYKAQLEKKWPAASFSVRAFPHDFGTYYEVVVNYNPDDETETDLAYEIESNLPATWDSEFKV